jgi:hypothetical protein
VQRYYDAGFTVPDDVLLLFCDNNWDTFDVQPSERTKASRRDGLYYHIDMNGGPWNEPLVNTTTIPSSTNSSTWLIVPDWMTSDHQRRRLKPKEYPIDFILRYAWNPDVLHAGKSTQIHR